jgi:hypothetical protein
MNSSMSGASSRYIKGDCWRTREAQSRYERNHRDVAQCEHDVTSDTPACARGCGADLDGRQRDAFDSRNPEFRRRSLREISGKR